MPGQVGRRLLSSDGALDGASSVSWAWEIVPLEVLAGGGYLVIKTRTLEGYSFGRLGGGTMASSAELSPTYVCQHGDPLASGM